MIVVHKWPVFGLLLGLSAPLAAQHDNRGPQTCSEYVSQIMGPGYVLARTEPTGNGGYRCYHKASHDEGEAVSYGVIFPEELPEPVADDEQPGEGDAASAPDDSDSSAGSGGTGGGAAGNEGSTGGGKERAQCPQDTKHDAMNGTVIRSRLDEPRQRQGFERQLFRGVKVGLPGWQRAHSQGAGTGQESAEGILYAPEEVNQQYQNRGIEEHLRDLFESKPEDEELCLTTVTYAHAGTMRLKEIQYRVDAVNPQGQSRRLFETAIKVENKRDNPKVSIE